MCLNRKIHEGKQSGRSGICDRPNVTLTSIRYDLAWNGSVSKLSRLDRSLRTQLVIKLESRGWYSEWLKCSGVTLVWKVRHQANFLTWCTYKVGVYPPLQKWGSGLIFPEITPMLKCYSSGEVHPATKNIQQSPYEQALLCSIELGSIKCNFETAKIGIFSWENMSTTIAKLPKSEFAHL